MAQNLDEIIERKIGFGRFQIRIFLLTSLVAITDGAKLVLIPLVVPIIQKEWNFNKTYTSILNSFFYLGMIFGSFIIGKFADKNGRSNLLILSSFGQFVSAFIFMYISNVGEFILLLLFYGFIFGMSLPLITAMVSEISTNENRGLLLVLINLIMTFGKLYACLISFIFLDDIHNGDWRSLFFFSSLIPLLSFLLNYFFLKESPRFLIATSKFEEAFEILDHMITVNDTGAKRLSEEEKEQLIEFQINTFDSQERASFLSLLNYRYRYTSIGLWIIWFSINFMFNGQLVIFHAVFGENGGGLFELMTVIFGEVPAIIFSLILIEHPKFGRKNSLIICFSLCGIISFVSYFLPKDNLAISFAIARFFMKLCFSFLYPLTTECYGTLNRTLGFGASNSIGRLGAFSSPSILFFLFRIDNYSVFLSFTFFSILSFLACSLIGDDTTGRNLDFSDYSIEMECYELVKR